MPIFAMCENLLPAAFDDIGAAYAGSGSDDDDGNAMAIQKIKKLFFLGGGADEGW